MCTINCNEYERERTHHSRVEAAVNTASSAGCKHFAEHELRRGAAERNKKVISRDFSLSCTVLLNSSNRMSSLRDL